MRLAEYLGRPAARLLEAEPFRGWPVERAEVLDSDPPVVGYSFKGRGLQMNCDLGDECVRSLFLEEEACAGAVLSDLPFSFSRAQVLAHFGAPSGSGEKFSDAILGEYGPWDRFQGPAYTVHVQYKCDSDSIEQVTLMRNDVAP